MTGHRSPPRGTKTTLVRPFETATLTEQTPADEGEAVVEDIIAVTETATEVATAQVVSPDRERQALTNPEPPQSAKSKKGETVRRPR